MVTSEVIVPLKTASAWSRESSAVLLGAPPLSYLSSAASSVSVRAVRSYSGGGVPRHAVSKAKAVPLIEAASGRVVAFDCLDPDDPDDVPGADGGFLLALDAWKLLDDGDCALASELAAETAIADGHAVADGATRRWLRPFPSEASLRAGHRLHSPPVRELPLRMLALYSVGVLLVCPFVRAPRA